MASYVQVDGMGEDSNIFSSRVRGHFIEEECKHALCSPGGGGARGLLSNPARRKVHADWATAGDRCS